MASEFCFFFRSEAADWDHEAGLLMHVECAVLYVECEAHHAFVYYELAVCDSVFPPVCTRDIVSVRECMRAFCGNGIVRSEFRLLLILRFAILTSHLCVHVTL